MKFKALVYKALLVSTAISGLCALPVPHNELLRLQRMLNKMARTAMCGKATKKVHGRTEATTTNPSTSSTTTYSAISTLDLYRYYGISSVIVELRVQRLRMYSRIASDTTKHSVILTAWFGSFGFEPTQDQLQHSWLLQIKTDFAALSPWIQEAQQFSLDPKYAFQHPELWVFFDFSVLKAAEISNCIAPWQHQELQQAVVTPTFLQSLHCKLIRDDGLVCQWIGESLNAVRRHITTSKYHKLSRTPCPSMMAITPTCPWCCSQLSSIESCANHIRRSFTRRTCPTKHSGHFQNPSAEIHRDLLCPLCKFFCADEKDYQLHV